MVVCFHLFLFLLSMMYPLSTGMYSEGFLLNGHFLWVLCFMYIVFWGKIGFHHISWPCLYLLCLRAFKTFVLGYYAINARLLYCLIIFISLLIFLWIGSQDMSSPRPWPYAVTFFFFLKVDDVICYCHIITCLVASSPFLWQQIGYIWLDIICKMNYLEDLLYFWHILS